MGYDPTSTDDYPAFASKDALMQAILDEIPNATGQVRDILNRLSNTDTSGWADPTGTKYQ